jgi:RHS repeat-associated protein
VIGTGNQLLNDGTNTYTYDKNGNTLTKTNTASGDVWYYTWNYKNQMTCAVEKTSSGTVLQNEQYTYDVEGRLIGVNVNGVQQSWTVFDGSNPYMDFNGAGTAVTMWYVTNPQSMDTFYARVSATGTTNWYVTDLLGSIRAIVDTNGNVLDAIVYDPWGNIVSESNAANGDRFKFDGGLYDATQQTYLFNARWLNPQDGRWESQDPLGSQAGDANLYRYVNNAPNNEEDSTGLESFDQLKEKLEEGGWHLIGSEPDLVNIGRPAKVEGGFLQKILSEITGADSKKNVYLVYNWVVLDAHQVGANQKINFNWKVSYGKSESSKIDLEVRGKFIMTDLKASTEAAKTTTMNVDKTLPVREDFHPDCQRHKGDIFDFYLLQQTISIYDPKDIEITKTEDGNSHWYASKPPKKTIYLHHTTIVAFWHLPAPGK